MFWDCRYRKRIIKIVPADLLSNWKQIVWWVGWTFKPDNVWNMYLDELEFWAEGVLFHIR
jgi:hypothetical protein